MHCSSFLLLATWALFKMVAPGSCAPCNCGLGPGVAGCPGEAPGCYPSVVRPQELPPIDLSVVSQPRVVCKTIHPVQPLKPIGGLCSCGQAIVKPANVPKPLCASCSHSQSSSQSSSSNIISTSSSQYYYPQQIQDSSPAADPVSLAIAYKQLAEQKNDAAERQLSFGFQQLPSDPPAPEPEPIPAEEKLYNVNGAILELVSRPSQKSVDEEALEELQQEEEEELQNEVQIPQVSYSALGYGTVQRAPVSFVSVSAAAAPALPEGIAEQHDCQDGFQKGKIVFSGTAQGGEEEESSRFYQVPSSSYRASISSSSSSSSHKKKCNVFIEQLKSCD